MHFYKGCESVPDPVSANDGLDGDIPLRAYQHCEPFLAANRVGHLLYPPVDFTLVWNGTEIFVQFEGVEEVLKLDKCFLPNFADYWINNTPPDAIDLMPPFLEAFPERGVLQAWTGFFVSTEADESTWIRGPVNRNVSSAYKIIEGIVETDWWFGMLFTNIQILRTDEPIAFSRSSPWLQVFEVPQRLHARKKNSPIDLTPSLAGFTPEAWAKMKETSDRRNTANPGSYRAASRRRAP